MTSLSNTLPILHAGHPIWYRGELAGVAANGEMYAVGWTEPKDRPVLRALALATFEAPQLTPDQQYSFAAYYVLPEERWVELQLLSDDLIALTECLPIDVVRRRRSLPSLGLATARDDVPAMCA
jgi:hypothetical protein